jgi:hypothetical protein
MTTIKIFSHWAADPEYANATGRVDPTWTGPVPSDELAAIWRLFNRVDDEDNHRLNTLGYHLPSLSVGDVVTLRTDQPDPEHHLVTPVGFHPLDADEYAALRASDAPCLAAEQLAWTVPIP